MVKHEHLPSRSICPSMASTSNRYLIYSGNSEIISLGLRPSAPLSWLILVAFQLQASLSSQDGRGCPTLSPSELPNPSRVKGSAQLLAWHKGSFTVCPGLSLHSLLPSCPQPVNISFFISPCSSHLLSWNAIFLLSLECSSQTSLPGELLLVFQDPPQRMLLPWGSTGSPMSSFLRGTRGRGAFLSQSTKTSLKAGSPPIPRCLPQTLNISQVPGMRLKSDPPCNGAAPPCMPNADTTHSQALHAPACDFPLLIPKPYRLGRCTSSTSLSPSLTYKLWWEL